MNVLQQIADELRELHEQRQAEEARVRAEYRPRILALQARCGRDTGHLFIVSALGDSICPYNVCVACSAPRT